VPALRFVNDSQENALWLGLTGLWAVAGLLSWCVAAGTVSSWIATPSWLVLSASLTCAISMALRLPILSESPRTSLRDDHAVWLLSTVANINWIGFFILQAPGWPDALPVLLIGMLGEVWFHTIATRVGALPWLRNGCTALLRQLSSLGADRPSRLEKPEPVSPGATVQEVGCVERRVVAGHDEQGRRYLSGEISVSLTADKPSDTIVVGFSPAFVGAPNVDLDCEADGVDVRLINCTPTGMRIGIRGLSLREPLDLALQWFAVEVELGRTPSLVATTRVLP
jgi:hypothetical protein